MSKAEEEGRDCVRGCLLGASVGSALALRLEDVSMTSRPSVLERGPFASGEPSPISGNAQLLLFTAEGLIRALVRYANKGICHPPTVVYYAYLRCLALSGIRASREPYGDLGSGWLSSVKALHRRRRVDPDTLEALKKGRVFDIENPPNHSKSSGALMRIAPVGLFASHPFELARDIATLTHGHVTGYLAPAFFALMLSELATGSSIEGAVAKAREPVSDNHYGDDVLIALDRAASAAEAVRLGGDRLSLLRSLGSGRSADDVLKIALFCIYIARDLREGLSLAVLHDGDIEATAMLVGAALGAAGSISALPADWLGSLELREEIETLADDLYRAPDEDLEDEGWWARYPGY